MEKPAKHESWERQCYSEISGPTFAPKMIIFRSLSRLAFATTRVLAPALAMLCKRRFLKTLPEA